MVNISRPISNRIINKISHKINNVPNILVGSIINSSAFDDIWGWWRADNITGSSPSMTFTDLSGNSRTMTQQAGTLTPGTAANGQAKVTGGSTAYLTSAATLESWPITVFTFGQRTNSTTQGFFGHTGATGYNTLWTGYESTNRAAIYNNNAQLNTNTATSGCWLTRIGYGSRINIINGLIQSTDTSLASIVRSSAVTTSIGTQYRGLNFNWQETLVWNRVLSLDEIDEVHAYLNARYGSSIPLWSSYTPATTILMHGQSNSAGRGDRGVSNANVPVEYRGAITGANVWHGVAASNTGVLGTAFETLNIDAAKTGITGNHDFGDSPNQPANYIGCETALCKEYLDLHSGSVYLNKWSLGGSNLAYRAALTYWHPTNNTLTHADNLRAFGQAMRNWWAALAVHQAAGRKPNIKGIIWHQGEQDAQQSTDSSAYSTNLPILIDSMRKEIGYSAANAKLFLCRIHDECPETYTSIVRSAQASVAAATSNCVLVNLDSYEPRSGDPVHLSYNGQIALGQYLATQL